MNHAIACIVADVLRVARDEGAVNITSFINLVSRFADTFGLEDEDRFEFIRLCRDEDLHDPVKWEAADGVVAWRYSDAAD